MMKTMKSEYPLSISRAETTLLSELADDLSTHLIESRVCCEPREAVKVAAAFFVGLCERGWKFTMEQVEI